MWMCEHTLLPGWVTNSAGQLNQTHRCCSLLLACALGCTTRGIGTNGPGAPFAVCEGRACSLSPRQPPTPPKCLPTCIASPLCPPHIKAPPYLKSPPSKHALPPNPLVSKACLKSMPPWHSSHGAHSLDLQIMPLIQYPP